MLRPCLTCGALQRATRCAPCAMPDAIRITGMPSRVTTRRVTRREDDGGIAETVDVEEDIP